MNSISVKQGGRLDLQVVTESTAVTCTIKMSGDSGVHEFTESYVNKVADFTNSTISDLDPGVYEYEIYDNYASGKPDIYPDPESCDDGCELPTITICASIEAED